jgi:ankyrin repeat protein
MLTLTETLLMRGADPNVVCKRQSGGGNRNPLQKNRRSQCKDFDNPTPLFVAAANGNYELAHLLLQSGAQVNYINSWRQTPLNRAAGKGHVDLIHLFVDWRAIVNPWEDIPIDPPIFDAASNWQAGALRALLKRGADPNASRHQYRWSPNPIHLVLFKYQYLSVNGQHFHSASTKDNEKDKDQQQQQQQKQQEEAVLECVKALVDSGSNLHVASVDGTPLQIAQRKRLNDVAGFLGARELALRRIVV